MAARQLDAVLFIDTRVSVEYAGDVADFSDLEFEGQIGDELMYLSRSIGRLPISDARVDSLVFAKRILSAPPQKNCGIWPWAETDLADYPEFIIGEDEYGKPVKYTCDPDCLANYFGKNPDAPHYLTPVFFKPEVLQRYYDDSDLYTVSDGNLSCASMWGVKIDNGNPNCVVVFLGDIGRDIPASHRTHWRSYNVSPTQRMSDVGVRRAFFGQFADSENPEHRFKLAYNQLQNSWEEHWGWRLHRKAEGQDAGVLQRLRIPVNDTDAELRAQLINLALVLVDYLMRNRWPRTSQTPRETKASPSSRSSSRPSHTGIPNETSVFCKESRGCVPALRHIRQAAVGGPISRKNSGMIHHRSTSHAS